MTKSHWVDYVASSSWLDAVHQPPTIGVEDPTGGSPGVNWVEAEVSPRAAAQFVRPPLRRLRLTAGPWLSRIIALEKRTVVKAWICTFCNRPCQAMPKGMRANPESKEQPPSNLTLLVWNWRSRQSSASTSHSRRFEGPGRRSFAMATGQKDQSATESPLMLYVVTTASTQLVNPWPGETKHETRLDHTGGPATPQTASYLMTQTVMRFCCNIPPPHLIMIFCACSPLVTAAGRLTAR
ncbi:hypothetical protein B0H66DRAFT_534552 [Apodospora peruviana]|uniref:Uncharacterized protein n=1 Tax=Apodospora peruviana TaxID=516989 RepID=A0AAE0M263_9PEZI|nr:hypothetical protein B0H66DRAFT_534552 [Apodospora peruviana]